MNAKTAGGNREFKQRLGGALYRRHKKAFGLSNSRGILGEIPYAEAQANADRYWQDYGNIHFGQLKLGKPEKIPAQPQRIVG